MKLFISYRRKTWAFAQRLAEQLGKLIDCEIFVDVTGIDNTDFETSILSHLRNSDAVLVIVSEYTFATERINQEDDWVRREMALALKLDKPIVLACVDGLYPPAPEQLPADIRDISRKQGIPFYSEFFDAAVRKLAEFITKATPIRMRPQIKPVSVVLLVASVTVTILVILVIATLYQGQTAAAGTMAAMGKTLDMNATLAVMATTNVALARTSDFDATSGALIAATLRAGTALANTARPPTDTPMPTPNIEQTVAAAATIVAMASASRSPSPSATPTNTLSVASGVDLTPSPQPSSTATTATTATPTLNVQQTAMSAASAIARASQTATPTPAPTLAALNQAAKLASPLPAGKYQIATDFGYSLGGTLYQAVALSAPVGTEVTAGSKGTIAYLITCTKCTDDQPNFISQGIAFADAKALSDPAWGYGFGNAIVARYAYNDLPATTRAVMDNQNLKNGYVYVIYANLSRMNVQAGAAIQAGTVIGLTGNTGNSTGPHMRLEVRLSMSANETSVFNRLLLNPHQVFDL